MKPKSLYISSARMFSIVMIFKSSSLTISSGCRDRYSSTRYFLSRKTFTKIQDIDKYKCITEFDDCYKKEKALITWIKAHKIKVLNSGIKIA